ncbi:MAG TPA: hypothetical protein VLA05_03220 [Coriobacteriia bacterium]|nr:hypothetical protein [Coriobacteriia bacterium]
MPEPDSSTDSAPIPEPAAPPEGGNLIDAATGLVQTAVTYVRQETGDVVREKVVLPTQKAGATVALAIGVALVLFLGVLFVSAGALILLAEWIGWPAALFAVGGVLILVSAGIAYARSRSIQP